MPEETALKNEVFFPRGTVLMRKDRALSEREVLELVKKGNREAYKEIVTRYMKTAYGIALGFVHNQQDALDISQESFIRAFRKIESYNTQRPFFPWFYKLMKNLCLDHLKRKGRIINEIPLENVQVPEKEGEDKELKEVLWRGIERLPLEQKEVIILRYFHQMSYREIAEITGKPIGTVMSSLYYAKKRLKEILGEFLGWKKKTRGDFYGPSKD